MNAFAFRCLAATCHLRWATFSSRVFLTERCPFCGSRDVQVRP